MKKVLLLLIALLLCTCSAMAAAPEGPFTYNTDWCYLTGYEGTDTVLDCPATFVLPDTGKTWEVQCVAEDAFAGRTELQAVILPEGYAAVQAHAFKGCTGLTAVTLPESMVVLDVGAFEGCTGMTGVTFGSGMSLIRRDAFKDAAALDVITFTGALCRVELGAFSGISENAVFFVPDDLLDEYTAELQRALPGANVVASGSMSVAHNFVPADDLFAFDAETGTITEYYGYLERVDIPASIGGVAVKHIGAGAFYRDGYLYYVTIPEGVESVGFRAFEDADRVAWVNFPSTLRTIDNYAFDFDGERVLLNEGLEHIGDHVFYHCGAQFTEVYLPSTLKSIGNACFQGGSLTSLTLPASLETIGDNAFYLNPLRDQELVIPEGVTSIGEKAFGNSYMKAVQLPSTLTSVGSQAFGGCTQLRYLTIASNSLDMLPADVFAGCFLFEGRGPMPEVKLTAADEAQAVAAQAWIEGNGYTASVFVPAPEGVYMAEAADFDVTEDGRNLVLGAYHADAASIILPDKRDGAAFKTIGEGAFRGNQTIKDVELPEGGKYTKIGKEAFADSSLASIVIPEGVTQLDEAAFRNCKNLTKVVLPASLKSMGANCFEGCTGLTEVVFLGKDTVVSMYYPGVFKGCTSLTAINFCDLANYSMCESMFEGCTALTSIQLPATLETIGANAFAGCTGLTAIELPPLVSNVGVAAFSGTLITSLSIPEAAANVFNMSLEGMADLEELRFSTKNLSRHFFENTPNLHSVYFNAVPDRIDETAFEGIQLDMMIVSPENAMAMIAVLPESLVSYLRVPDDVSDEALAALNAEAGLPWYASLKRVSDEGGLDRMTENASDDREFAMDRSNYSILSYLGTDTELVIPRTVEQGHAVTGINDRAFAGKDFTSVVIPDSVTFIGEGAFADCAQLETVTCYGPLETLGANAFANCPNLKQVTFVNGLAAIGDGAFMNCASLHVEQLPENVQTIGAHAFTGCAGVTLHVTNVMQYVAEDALEQAGEVSVLLDGDVNCALGFVTMDVQQSTVISELATDEQAAAINEKLGTRWYKPVMRAGEVFTLPLTMIETPTDAALFEFDAATGTLRGYYGDEIDVVIPAEIGGVPVRVIGRQTFDRCRDYTDTEIITDQTEWVHLRSVVIPETVEVIEDSAFEYCQQLQRVICYAPLETTGRATFLYCRKLNTVQFLNGVACLDNYLFQRCDALENMYFGEHLDRIGTEVFSFADIKHVYLNAVTIDQRAVHACPELTELHIGERVKSAGFCMVAECQALETVYIEGENAAFLPGDGLMSDVGTGYTVYVKPYLPDEDRTLLTKKLNVWSMDPAAVTLENGYCSLFHDRLEQPVPLMDEMIPAADPEPEPVAAPTGIPADDGLIGTWKLEKVEKGGEYYTPEQMGFNMTAAFNADGTALMDTGAPVSCGWTEESGMIVVDLGGEKQPFLYDGQYVTTMIGSMTLYLVKDGAAAAPSAPEANIESQPISETELLGLWQMTEVGEGGATYSAEEFGLQIGMQFNADGTALITVMDEAEAMTWTLTDHVQLTMDGSVIDVVYDGERLIVPDDGSMMYFVRSAGQPEADQPSAPAHTTGDAAADYIGTWYCIHLKAGSTEGSPMSLWGLVITLTLNEDGTGCMNYGGPDSGMIWYYDELNERYYYGTGEGGRVDAPLTFTEEGYLLHGTVAGGYLIFSHNPGDVVTIFPQDAVVSVTATPVPAATEAPSAPAADTGSVIGVKFVATKANASGTILDASSLGGEYSITFNADGSATFVLVGTPIPGLAWTQQGSTYLVDYFGTPLTFTFLNGELLMDYFGAMTLTMVAQ